MSQSGYYKCPACGYWAFDGRECHDCGYRHSHPQENRHETKANPGGA